VPMSKTVAPAASKFMHAQASVCSILTCQNLIGTIFSFVILNQFNATAQYLPYLHQNGTSTGLNWQLNMAPQVASRYWISAVVSLVWAICIGSAVLLIARSMLSSRNQGGLKFCCIFEGIVAGVVGCQSLCACGSLIMVATFVATISSGAAYCNEIYFPGQLTPVTPDQIATAPQRFDYFYCEDGIAGVRKICIIFTVNLALFMVMTCGYASACGVGSKFAAETGDLMEDEEAGGDQDYY